MRISLLQRSSQSIRCLKLALGAVTFLAACFLQSRADMVSDWNSIANTVFLNSGRPGGAVIVDMAYVHIAIYDAVNAIDGRFTRFAVAPQSAVPWASKESAIAAAAYGVLVAFYPSQQVYLDSVYAHSLADVQDGDSKTGGIAIGREVAEKFLALRANDGRNANVPYTFLTGPGVYQLTPGAPPPPATPQTPWLAHLKPFAMLSPDQFRVSSPPALSSDLFARDFNEIKMYGAHDGSARTVAQTQIGQFYAENPGVQLSRNLRLFASARGMSLADNARLFAQIYATIADAVIAGWDSKFYYNFWRPVTAIRAGDTDGNPQTDPDTSWLPLVVTPGHPEYPAAHGCVTGGLAYALEKFFATKNVDITLTSTSVPGIASAEHHFGDINDIVTDVINARVYGGVHYRNSVEHGAAIARDVADWVADHFFKPSGSLIPQAHLQLWLRADTGLTLNGATVGRWADQSGNGNDALQNDPSRQPALVAGAVNGKPAIHFDGLNDKLGLTGSARMSRMSLFMVYRYTSGDAVITFGAHGDLPEGHQLFILDGYSQDVNEIALGFSPDHYVRATGSGLGSSGQWRNLSVTSDSSILNTTLRWNGKDALMQLVGTDWPNNFPLGDSIGSGGGIGGADGVPDGTLKTECDVAEVIVYNSVLSDSARLAVENYLNTKYRLVPTPIPTAGLQLWLRADEGIDILNGKVSKWHDQSGHANDAIQADTARQPVLLVGALNGKPVLRFDGVNDRLGLTGTTPMRQISMFLVFKIDSGATSVPSNQAGVHPYYPIQLGDSYIEGGVYGLSMRNDFNGNSPDIIDPFTGGTSWEHATLTGIASFGEWKVLSVTTDKLMYSTSLRVGGREAVTSPQTNTNMAISVPLGSADGLGVGGIGGGDHLDPGFGSSIFKGDIAEVMVYDTVLADADRRGVENYLNAKYQLGTAVAESHLSTRPEVTRLEQNYPNPFNPSTSIQFQLSAPGHVTLKVFDLLGRELVTLVDENKQSGIYSVRFDGGSLASGVYFFRLHAGSVLQTRKMILTK